jgi:hypothetical protein
MQATHQSSGSSNESRDFASQEFDEFDEQDWQANAGGTDEQYWLENWDNDDIK